MNGPRLVRVYKSRRKLDMYLYVDMAEGLARVPEMLLERFGAPEPALTLRLTRERRLARADAAEVLEALDRQGFYLQLPPPVGAVSR
ncbi:MAG: YcgL domain-containing protein [Pseudomonadales bacterium]